ncbi:MAG: DUF4135 domain-containing protein [Lachnospiraceae bacterium]|nr:DUF4135 domain-containing protein [Lachnospiraceae bacterium]
MIMKEQELILNQVNKHKKALFFVFFDCLAEEENQVRELVKMWSDRDENRTLIVFEDDKKVIYQKEKLSLERGMNKYFAWMNQSVMKDKKLYCRKLLEYPDCSFLEMVYYQKYRNIEERRDYYYRIGSLMALIASLGGNLISDLDMIAMQDQPILDNLNCLSNDNIQFCKNMIKYEGLKEKNDLKYEPEDQEEIERGYNAIYDYVFNNIADTKAAIELFFEK